MKRIGLVPAYIKKASFEEKTDGRFCYAEEAAAELARLKEAMSIVRTNLQNFYDNTVNKDDADDFLHWMAHIPMKDFMALNNDMVRKYEERRNAT